MPFTFFNRVAAPAKVDQQDPNPFRTLARIAARSEQPEPNQHSTNVDQDSPAQMFGYRGWTTAKRDQPRAHEYSKEKDTSSDDEEVNFANPLRHRTRQLIIKPRQTQPRANECSKDVDTSSDEEGHDFVNPQRHRTRFTIRQRQDQPAPNECSKDPDIGPDNNNIVDPSHPETRFIILKQDRPEPNQASSTVDTDPRPMTLNDKSTRIQAKRDQPEPRTDQFGSVQFNASALPLVTAAHSNRRKVRAKHDQPEPNQDQTIYRVDGGRQRPAPSSSQFAFLADLSDLYEACKNRIGQTPVVAQSKEGKRWRDIIDTRIKWLREDREALRDEVQKCMKVGRVFRFEEDSATRRPRQRLWDLYDRILADKTDQVLKKDEMIQKELRRCYEKAHNIKKRYMDEMGAFLEGAR